MFEQVRFLAGRVAKLLQKRNVAIVAFQVMATRCKKNFQNALINLLDSNARREWFCFVKLGSGRTCPCEYLVWDELHAGTRLILVSRRRKRKPYWAIAPKQYLGECIEYRQLAVSGDRRRFNFGILLPSACGTSQRKV